MDPSDVEELAENTPKITVITQTVAATTEPVKKGFFERIEKKYIILGASLIGALVLAIITIVLFVCCSKSEPKPE